MILPRLLWRFLRFRDDPVFYELQAVDAIRWLEAKGVRLGASTTVLDLGCGHGVFGGELIKRGCRVTFADESNQLRPEHRAAPFLTVNLDRDSLAGLGRFELVICSNVLEHLAQPEKFLRNAEALLADGGQFYLSWTNWLSPWGGHEFSPLHYLGAKTGARLYDKLSRRPRFHQPHVNLFPTYIGHLLRVIREDTQLELVTAAPRYYTEFPFLMAVPGLREFAAWNCALLLRRKV